MDRLSTITTEHYRQLEAVELMRVLSSRAFASRFGDSAEEYYRLHWGESVTAPVVLKAFAAERQAVALDQKAAVAPGTTTDPAWAGALATSTLAGSFLALVRQASVLAKVPVSPVPFGTPMQTQVSGASMKWIGEGILKPVTKLGLGTVALSRLKASGIIAVTAELMKLSAPGSERALQQILSNELTTFVDGTLLSAAAATPASPPGILSGVTPSADIAATIAAFFTARPHAIAPTWITSPANLGPLSALDLRVPAQFKGYPLVTSPSAGANLILVDAPALAVADDGLELDVSTQAAIEMNDAPVGTAAAVVRSLWQENLVGIRAERFINWQLAPGAVQFTATLT